jgi:O-methyltransferase
MFKFFLSRCKRAIMGRPVKRASGSILAKSSRFLACEIVAGDYFEFGVYQGKTFCDAYYWLNKNFKSRINLDVGGERAGPMRARRAQIWKDMRFFAFDSFEGLPELSTEDQCSEDFSAGQYACNEHDFLKRISAGGVPLNRVKTVPGFFNETCTPQTINKYQLKHAALIWLDADLYSSTRDVLSFIRPLLQDGTVIVFDDWFSFKGNPGKGVQRAFYEWSQELTNTYRFVEYQRDSWKRMSFIVSEL